MFRSRVHTQLDGQVRNGYATARSRRESAPSCMKYANTHPMASQHPYISTRQRNYNNHCQNLQEYDSQTVLGIIAELGSESNAHGLAKIVTSRDTKRKVIWALLVIIGFTAATLQLSLLVRKYLQFQVVELSEIKDSMPVEYPSVTVCNIEPISLRKLREIHSRDTTKVIQKWLHFLDIVTFNERAFMNSIRAFYENLGDEAKKISHDLGDLLIHCRFNRELCSVQNFTSFFDGNYFNCFTFNGGQLKDKLQMHSTGPENGLSLVISVEKDDPIPGTYGVYNFENNIMHSAGIRVVVHAPGSMPSPVDHGFDIPPGYSSSVGLKALLHSRLPEPYGNCTEGSLQGMHTYRNTFFACLQLCKQKLIIARCGCKSSALPDLPNVNVSFCGVISNWLGFFMEVRKMNMSEPPLVPIPALECEERVQHEVNNDRAYEATCQCYQPCSETSYLKSVSLSYWPLEFYQVNAVEKFFGIKDNSGKQKFMEKAFKILDKQRNITQTPTKKLRTAPDKNQRKEANEASDYIRQNMLRLNIYLEDLSVVEYRQLPAYGLADLFADIGGTLGLWMGISVLTIMELVELVIRLSGLMFNVEKKGPPPPKQASIRKHVGYQTSKTNAHLYRAATLEKNYPDPYAPETDFRRGADATV
ncbi:FMRFamide-activated amiloride-sensitive sodium channel-like [Physella acuta]|uniref:FMRFamide-activated amiloride-sensitive sodium channel-like n=1 Tax=Physella acuta TaxID=109671 RepID=UPI0027DBA400|nr:FMRFamide-activated amiloride-sensitive sodium channel-like [Physella acuta]